MTHDLSSLRIGYAKTEAEREAVYRLRYDVYVEEMGRYHSVADHVHRRFVEPEDNASHILYAELDGEVVATARTSWASAISERQIEHYQLQPFLDVIPLEAVAVGERAMVVSRLRGTSILMDVFKASLEFANERRIQICFGACEPHLLNLYVGLGQRTYSSININSAEAGYLIPLLFIPEDIEYLERIDSILRPHLKDFGPDARIPACVKDLVNDGGAVRSSRLVDATVYWEQISQSLDTRPSIFDGLTLEEEGCVLGKSSIIECRAGDRILKKYGVARNLYVVLSGVLETRDDGRVVRAMTAGDVFGEIAFLLNQPRSMDVYAATDEVRVLSLSENNIRMLIENDPTITAKLLLNLSKMLCRRLLL
jgi:predicted GNAT family N-acyltransferase